MLEKFEQTLHACIVIVQKYIGRWLFFPFVDSSWSFFQDPYHFIPDRCEDDSDGFQTRLMGERTICLMGAEAAQLFTDPTCFVRHGAMPEVMLATLFGKGAIHGLDGKAHSHRKQLFMSIITPSNNERFGKIFERWLSQYCEKWAQTSTITLYEATHEPLMGAICEWAEVPLQQSEFWQRTKDVVSLFDNCTSFLLGHVRSRIARIRSERWISRLINEIRSNTSEFAHPDNVLHNIAWHRDHNCELLDARIAAVEVLNVLRPTVAVSIFIAHAAVILSCRPDLRERLRQHEEGLLYLFAQEVRRTAPFAPALPARACKDFRWHGFNFSKGTKAMLSIYGTNHDPRVWLSPNEFNPARFRNFQPEENQYVFIPQGAGNPHIHHRCPGEGIAMQAIQVSVEMLANKLEYDVPTQDFDIDWRGFPALPRSRVIINNIRLVEQKNV